MEKTYIAIDLKSFYASVECKERNLNPLTTNLVVADISRTSKTICLAISPSLKSYGLPGRARLFEVEQKIKEINRDRKKKINYQRFTGKSSNFIELNKNPYLELDYVIAPPRMSFYINYSTKIYNTYLKYISPDDIHVYSIDEVFIDATDYLKLYKTTAHELARKMISDVLKTTGITATAGIGTNLYLAKVAMDIVAKHIPADAYGVRIAELDEMKYRKELWNHVPLTDFWRVGKGIAKRLEKLELYTMGDIAKCSLGNITDKKNEDILYKEFGVNAELLIDHAWGYEPCTIKDIKNYKPKINSISTGQVLSTPYNYEKTKLIIKEMIDNLVLELVDKKLITNQIILNLNYDADNLKKDYKGEIKEDYYGRLTPKEAHGTTTLDKSTSSTKIITNKSLELYDRITNKKLTVKRITIAFGNVTSENNIIKKNNYEQLNLFNIKKEEIKEENPEELEKEKKIQKTILDIKKKYGKNSILKGMNLESGATAIDRNNQIGGHKA